MAGNNSIQFVRGTSTRRASHTEASLIGQPIYETDTKKLYVGDGTTAVKDLEPVGGESLKPASQTVLGGIKAWMSGNTLYISTQV